MTTNYSITERFKIARKKDREDYKAKEVAKLGNLRAGSTGMMAQTGDIAGNCHRKSHLRSLGLEIEEPTEDKLIMFELGYANEDRIMEILKSSLAEDETILREEEIPIEWNTSNGTKVSGRPDIVICKKADWVITSEDAAGWSEMDPHRPEVGTIVPGAKSIPVLGLELKSVHSVWTAREVLFNRHPKTPNLVQAAHYMWKLNIPYKLHYRSYSQLGQGGSDWLARMLPKPGEALSEYIDFNDKGKMKHVKQFDCVYDLRFTESGRLQFKLEEEPESLYTNTIITRQDIERYFEYVSQMATNKDLGPRPMTIDPQGGKLNYTDCGYCPLQATCDTHEDKGYEVWLKEVKKVLQFPVRK